MTKPLQLICLLLFLISTEIKSQLPNNDFESLNFDGTLRNWGNIYLFSGGFIDSSGIFQMDSIVFDNGYFYKPTSDAHTGSVALELANAWNFASNQGITGSASCDTDSVFMGFSSFELIPVQTQPTQFSFYYKFLPVNGDTAVARLSVFDSLMNPLGEAVLFIDAAASGYTFATTPVIYSQPGTPAFCNVNFSTFYTDAPGTRQPGFGTRLLIDDVTLDNTSGIKNESIHSTLTCYPNPCVDVLNVRSESLLNDFTIQLTDLTGKILVLEDNQKQIDVSWLDAGIYFVRIKTDQGILEKKILKTAAANAGRN